MPDNPQNPNTSQPKPTADKSAGNGALPSGGGAAGQAPTALDSFHYAELNPGISVAYKANSFDRKAVNQSLNTVVQGAMTAFEKDAIAGTGPYKAIVLRQEPPWTQEGADVTSWYSVFNKALGGTEPTNLSTVVQVKARIPELHQLIPITNQTHIDLHPTFTSKDDNGGAQVTYQPNELVWVDFGNRYTFEDPILIGPVKKKPETNTGGSPGGSGTGGDGSGKGAAHGWKPGGFTPENLKQAGADNAAKSSCPTKGPNGTCVDPGSSNLGAEALRVLVGQIGWGEMTMNDGDRMLQILNAYGSKSMQKGLRKSVPGTGQSTNSTPLLKCEKLPAPGSEGWVKGKIKGKCHMWCALTQSWAVYQAQARFGVPIDQIRGELPKLTKSVRGNWGAWSSGEEAQAPHFQQPKRLLRVPTWGKNNRYRKSWEKRYWNKDGSPQDAFPFAAVMGVNDQWPNAGDTVNWGAGKKPGQSRGLGHVGMVEHYDSVNHIMNSVEGNGNARCHGVWRFSGTGKGGAKMSPLHPVKPKHKENTSPYVTYGDIPGNPTPSATQPTPGMIGSSPASGQPGQPSSRPGKCFGWVDPSTGVQTAKSTGKGEPAHSG